MAVPVREAPAPFAAPASPLDDVLRRVNRIRTAHGADPLYELPAACTAWEGGGCVLERAFEDLDVLVVDYRRAYGRHNPYEHGLGDYAPDFDAGRYPGLLASPRASSEGSLFGWPESSEGLSDEGVLCGVPKFGSTCKSPHSQCRS
jgi:hypothetical protein